MSAKQYSQLGQLESEPVLKWRQQTSHLHLGKINVLRVMTYWWLTLDPDTQVALHHLPADSLEAFFQGYNDADAGELRKALRQYKQNQSGREAG